MYYWAHRVSSLHTPWLSYIKKQDKLPKNAERIKSMQNWEILSIERHFKNSNNLLLALTLWPTNLNYISITPHFQWTLPNKVILYESSGEPFFMEQNLRFELVLGQLDVLKTAKNNLKYAKFEGNFFMFSLTNKFYIFFKIIVASALKSCITYRW